MSRAATPPLVPLLGLGVALGVPLGQAALAVPGLQAALLFLAPMLLLAAVLGCGRYPGERALASARARWSDRRRTATTAERGPVAARGRPSPPRGSLVLAHHLAVRPPPASLPFAA